MMDLMIEFRFPSFCDIPPSVCSFSILLAIDYNVPGTVLGDRDRKSNPDTCSSSPFRAYSLVEETC